MPNPKDTLNSLIKNTSRLLKESNVARNELEAAKRSAERQDMFDSQTLRGETEPEDEV
jgi:hypothetical protein